MKAWILALSLASSCVVGCAFWKGIVGGAESGVTDTPPPPPGPGDNRTLYELGVLIGSVGSAYVAGRYLGKRNGSGNPAAPDS
jgi:hypothetical protein